MLCSKQDKLEEWRERRAAWKPVAGHSLFMNSSLHDDDDEDKDNNNKNNNETHDKVSGILTLQPHHFLLRARAQAHRN